MNEEGGAGRLRMPRNCFPNSSGNRLETSDVQRQGEFGNSHLGILPWFLVLFFSNLALAYFCWFFQPCSCWFHWFPSVFLLDPCFGFSNLALVYSFQSSQSCLGSLCCFSPIYAWLTLASFSNLAHVGFDVFLALAFLIFALASLILC